MTLTMSGLDYLRAPLDIRQQLAFSAPQQEALLAVLRTQCPCILLSTCNRTELYTTGGTDTPWRLLCRAAGADEDALEPYFITRTGADAVRHLTEVACGLHSQIPGDDQIVTQIRAALELALAQEAADPVLSTAFRLAVTAGKRAKTEVPLHRVNPSLALRSIALLEQELGSLQGRSVLIIGSGQMGRLCADLLLEQGAAVFITQRTCRSAGPALPQGCTIIPYDRRLELLEQVDAVISATASPHCPLDEAACHTAAHLPAVLIDLAIPRDIDPSWSRRTRLYDLDSLGAGPAVPEETLAQLRAIAAQAQAQFSQWQLRQQARPPRFPLFIDLTDRPVVVIGGGVIASRRIAVLKQFGCRVTVISPTLNLRPEQLTWLARPYAAGDLEGAVLAVAASNDRAVNHAVWEEATARGIPISVADREEECSFYFPAICTGSGLVAGVVSTGKDHHKTARAAKAIRRTLEELE